MILTLNEFEVVSWLQRLPLLTNINMSCMDRV